MPAEAGHARIDCTYPAGCTGCRHQPPTDDLRVTVDRLAAIGTGRATVTVKFGIDAAFFDDVPVDQWISVAVAQIMRRHAAERLRTSAAASAVSQAFQDRLR